MQKITFTLYLILCFAISSGQIRKFNNSAVKGKALTCSGYVEKYPCYDSTCRKIGKWVYYYRNGNVERIENYRKIDDCSSAEIPDGIWEYFNEEGHIIKQDEYKNGILWKSDLAKYYSDDKLAGEMLVRNGIWDTIEYSHSEGTNLIKNGDFHLYFGPSKVLIVNGQMELDKQIPFWFSPVNNTPDYYNQNRGLKNVPDNLTHEFNEKYNYVGIILYHKPTGNYSEYITGIISSGLQSGKHYCVRIRIRLSQNSGYCIDKMGVLLSDNIPNAASAIPQISFDGTLDNRDNWATLCAFYTATGDEKYITIGRFLSPDHVTVTPIVPLNKSEGEYNQSAYYLVDDVELVNDTIDCYCKMKYAEDQLTNRSRFDLMDPVDSLFWDKTYILSNIFFEFNQSDLLPASFKELEKLLEFLKTNNLSIMISGHTDNIGLYDYNKALSLERAGAVSEWLIDKGIEKNRIEIEGFGPDLPITNNDTEENRSVNRRVEFKMEAPKRIGPPPPTPSGRGTF